MTPASDAILPSITNDSLMTIAEEDLDLAVERRPIAFDEISSGKFSEVAACGTAVVLTPVGSVTRHGVEHAIPARSEPGPTCADLYKRLTEIQCGDAPDPRDWTRVVVPAE